MPCMLGTRMCAAAAACACGAPRRKPAALGRKGSAGELGAIGGILTPADIYFTALVAFYRARVEQVIARLKKHQWCHTPFRSSFALLCVHHNISSVMTALEIRREIEAGQPLFEVIGPWPHNI